MENEKVYGRKVIRNSSAVKKSNAKRILVMILAGAFLLGGVIGGLITGLVIHGHNSNNVDTEQIVIMSKPFGTASNDFVARELLVKWERGNTFDFEPLDIPLDIDLQEYIFCISYAYNIDYSLTLAIIEHESGFNANAVSATDDYGLMQINKINHQWLSEMLGVNDFLDPKQNVNAGLYILRRLFDKYGDSANNVLMAYALGESGAQRFWNQGIYSIQVVDEILELQMKYERQGENNVK